MPYKHKNGCTCMTMPEFLQAEGEREGKTGGEIWREITDELEADNRRQENYWKENPDEVLKLMVEEAELTRECIVEEVPTPTKVLEILEVACNQSLRTSSDKMVVKARCDDGKTRVFTMTHSHVSGTYYDPPEDDGEFDWEECDD